MSHIDPMTNEDLKKFVLGYCDGRIFITEDARTPPSQSIEEWGETLKRVFLPLGLSPFPLPDNLGQIWEWMDQALPSAVDRLPMFVSCRMMSVDDWTRAKRAIIEEMKRRKEIEV